MVDSLIHLLILVVVLGLVCWVVLYCIKLLPMAGPFQQIATAIVILVALLIFLTRALPLLGVSLALLVALTQAWPLLGGAI